MSSAIGQSQMWQNLYRSIRESSTRRERADAVDIRSCSCSFTFIPAMRTFALDQGGLLLSLFIKLQPLSFRQHSPPGCLNHRWPGLDAYRILSLQNLGPDQAKTAG